MSYYCYLIICENRTYIGITNNLKKRIDKHNGKLKGGAKSTRCKENSKSWEYYKIVGKFNSKSEAMRFEWYWKHTKNNKNNWQRTASGIANKNKRLCQLFTEQEWMDKKLSVVDNLIYNEQIISN